MQHRRQSQQLLLQLLRRCVVIHDHEVSPALHAAGAMFCVLASYFVLVPLREEAGISLGTDALPKLFVGTLLGTLLLAPAASALLAPQPAAHASSAGSGNSGSNSSNSSGSSAAGAGPGLNPGSGHSSPQHHISASGAAASLIALEAGSRGPGGVGYEECGVGTAPAVRASTSGTSAHQQQQHPKDREGGLARLYVLLGLALIGFYLLYSASTAHAAAHVAHAVHVAHAGVPNLSLAAAADAAAAAGSQGSNGSGEGSSRFSPVSSTGAGGGTGQGAESPSGALTLPSPLALRAASPAGLLSRGSSDGGSGSGGGVPGKGVEREQGGQQEQGSDGVGWARGWGQQAGGSHGGRGAGSQGGAGAGLERQLLGQKQAGSPSPQGMAGTGTDAGPVAAPGAGRHLLADQQGSKAGQGVEHGSESLHEGADGGVRSPPPPMTAAAPAHRTKALSTRLGDPGLDYVQRAVRALFYVWLNAQNLVAASALWGRCADAFTPEAGSRLFGLVSAGATSGQLVGSLVTVAVTTHAAAVTAAAAARQPQSQQPRGAGPPTHALMLLSAGLMFAAAWLSARITAPRTKEGVAAAAAHLGPQHTSSHSSASQVQAISTAVGVSGSSPPLTQRHPPGGQGSGLTSRAAAAAAAVTGPAATAVTQAVTVVGPGGGRVTARARARRWAAAAMPQALEGFALIARSPYLSMCAAYLMATYAVGSLIYFQRALVVAHAVKAPAARTAFLAQVYSASATAICVMQLVATGRLIAWLGVTASISLFPVSCLISIAAVTALPTTTAVAVSEVVRKVLGYAVVRPAREVLFTVVSREEKYKAKVVLDSVVQRLGDVVAAGVFEVADVWLRAGLRGVAFAGCAACVVWWGVALRLGHRHAALAARQWGLP